MKRDRTIGNWRWWVSLPALIPLEVIALSMIGLSCALIAIGRVCQRTGGWLRDPCSPQWMNTWHHWVRGDG